MFFHDTATSRGIDRKTSETPSRRGNARQGPSLSIRNEERPTAPTLEIHVTGVGRIAPDLRNRKVAYLEHAGLSRFVTRVVGAY